jgi:hypothetical protein
MSHILVLQIYYYKVLHNRHIMLRQSEYLAKYVFHHTADIDSSSLVQQSMSADLGICSFKLTSQIVQAQPTRSSIKISFLF